MAACEKSAKRTSTRSTTWCKTGSSRWSASTSTGSRAIVLLRGSPPSRLLGPERAPGRRSRVKLNRMFVRGKRQRYGYVGTRSPEEIALRTMDAAGAGIVPCCIFHEFKRRCVFDPFGDDVGSVLAGDRNDPGKDAAAWPVRHRFGYQLTVDLQKVNR